MSERIIKRLGAFLSEFDAGGRGRFDLGQDRAFLDEIGDLYAEQSEEERQEVDSYLISMVVKVGIDYTRTMILDYFCYRFKPEAIFEALKSSYDRSDRNDRKFDTERMILMYFDPDWDDGEWKLNGDPEPIWEL